MKKKPVMITSILVKIMFVVKIITNMIFVSREGASYSFFNMAESIIDVYALAANLGFIKNIAEEFADGRVIYDVPVPILPVGIVRVVEAFYVCLLHTINLRSFIVLVATDALYLALLLIDKSSYYYESVKEVFDEDSGGGKVS